MLTALNDRQSIMQGVAPNVNIETGARNDYCVGADCYCCGLGDYRRLAVLGTWDICIAARRFRCDCDAARHANPRDAQPAIAGIGVAYRDSQTDSYSHTTSYGEAYRYAQPY